MRLAKYSTSTIEQHGRLVRSENVSLCKRSRNVGPCVNSTLAPGQNGGRSTIEDNSASDHTHRDRDIGKFCIVNDQRSSEAAITGLGIANEYRSINDNSIDNSFSSGSLTI